jgi:hypothetical protein
MGVIIVTPFENMGSNNFIIDKCIQILVYKKMPLFYAVRG